MKKFFILFLLAGSCFCQIINPTNATTVNGGVIPANAPCTGTNASRQFTSVSCGGGATIPSTSNLVKGDGAGNGADSGIAPASVPLTFPATIFAPVGSNAVSYATGQTINRVFATDASGNAGSFALTLAMLPSSIPLSSFATIPNNTVLGNVSGGTAVPTALNAANLATVLGSGAGPFSLTGQTGSTPSTPSAGNTTFFLPTSGGPAGVDAGGLLYKMPLSVSGVTAGTYGDATHCIYETVNAQGIVTNIAQSTSCPGGVGGNGTGVITYSGPALTTVTGTVYCSAGGGATCSATEANVDLLASSAATISNLSVQLSAAVGAGNSVAITWRNNTTSQSSTCTISGASATSCTDLTHSFSISQGDLIDYQLVFTGTIIVNPLISIMSQLGTIGTLSAAPPYLKLNGTFLIPSDGMYQATLPSLGSWTTIGSTTNTLTTGTNGDVFMSSAGYSFLADPTHIASIEAVLRPLGTSGNANTTDGIFAYDSTNSKIYVMTFNSGTPGSAGISALYVYTFTYSGSGSPSFSTVGQGFAFPAQVGHLKISISGTTMTYSESINGGVTFQSIGTQTVGTIAKLGLFTGFTSGSLIDIYSVVVQ